MTHHSLSRQNSPISEHQFALSLAELAKSNYGLADNFYLTNALSYFLFNAIENIPMTYVYPVSSIEIMEHLFESEVRFAKEAVKRIETYLQHPLKATDYLSLTESMIAANYQLDVSTHEEEEYLNLIHCLLTQMTYHLKLPRIYLFTEGGRLLRHIKFLALRILKKQAEPAEANNELYFYVKDRYLTEFHTANQMRVFVTESFDFDLSNDEISYLALYFHQIRKRYDRAPE